MQHKILASITFDMQNTYLVRNIHPTFLPTKKSISHSKWKQIAIDTYIQLYVERRIIKSDIFQLNGQIIGLILIESETQFFSSFQNILSYIYKLILIINLIIICNYTYILRIFHYWKISHVSKIGIVVILTRLSSDRCDSISLILFRLAHWYFVCLTIGKCSIYMPCVLFEMY